MRLMSNPKLYSIEEIDREKIQWIGNDWKYSPSIKRVKEILCTNSYMKTPGLILYYNDKLVNKIHRRYLSGTIRKYTVVENNVLMLMDTTSHEFKFKLVPLEIDPLY